MDTLGVGLVSGLAGAVLFGIAAVVQAGAARRLPEGGLWSSIRAGARDPLMLAVLAAYLVGAVLHLVAIGLTPLYLAQAATSASLLVTAAAASRMLRERLGVGDWVAILATVLGIALLAVDAGAAGAGVPSGFRVALHVGVVVLVVLGLLARALPDPYAGPVLGLVGGLGYSGTTLAARLLGSPSLSWGSLDALLVLGAYGGVGFVVYTLALRRAAAAGATAPLVVAQTGVPTLVGIVALGDGAPPVVLLVAGLALALAGSIRLAMLESRAGLMEA